MRLSPKRKGQHRDRLLFLGSGLFLVIFVLVGFAKAQRWGTRYVDVYIQASDVNGLNHGEDIRIAGIVAGQVGTMHLNDQGEVKVKLKIEANKSHLVGPSSKASLAKEGLIGEPYLVITADPRPREQAQEIEGRTIAYEEPINIDVLLKELASSQQLLNVTLRNTTALTAADGSISTAFNSTRRLAESLQKEVAATAPLVRESMTSVAKDLQAVSDSTTAVEQDTRSLIETTQPLVVETLKDADQLTRSSQELVDILRNLFGSWLEPVDGHRDAMKEQDSTTK
jgi:phospholipid/cholesterol/gamma-HCH transport system substrate-binding protein